MEQPFIFPNMFLPLKRDKNYLAVAISKLLHPNLPTTDNYVADFGNWVG
jgi:hypothetical protein